MSLQYLKKVSNEAEELKGLRTTIQKDEKSALFCNSVSSVISSSKFSFKEKNNLKFIISFNFSKKKNHSWKRVRSRGHLIFFSFGTQNQFAYVKVYCTSSINWLKIDKIQQFNKKSTIARETFTEAVVQKCFAKKVFLRT